MPDLNQIGPDNFNLASAGASAGTTSTLTTSTNTNLVVGGVFATTYAAASNAATPTTDGATGTAFIALQPNQTCMLVFGTDVSGNLKMMQGPIIATLPGVTTTVGGFQNDPQPPVMPDTITPFAYTLVRTAPSAAAWTPGSSSWTASGVSATTFKNIARMPRRPVSS